jgi:hypothetical protein
MTLHILPVWEAFWWGCSSCLHCSLYYMEGVCFILWKADAVSTFCNTISVLTRLHGGRVGRWRFILEHATYRRTPAATCRPRRNTACSYACHSCSAACPYYLCRSCPARTPAPAAPEMPARLPTCAATDTRLEYLQFRWRPLHTILHLEDAICLCLYSSSVSSFYGLHRFWCLVFSAVPGPVLLGDTFLFCNMYTSSFLPIW